MKYLKPIFITIFSSLFLLAALYAAFYAGQVLYGESWLRGYDQGFNSGMDACKRDIDYLVKKPWQKKRFKVKKITALTINEIKDLGTWTKTLPVIIQPKENEK